MPVHSAVLQPHTVLDQRPIAVDQVLKLPIPAPIVVHRNQESAAQALGQVARIQPVAFALAGAQVTPRIRHHQLFDHGLEQLVEPIRVGPLLERQMNSRAQTTNPTRQPNRLCRQNPFGHQTTAGFQHCVTHTCLMYIQTDILILAHGCPPFELCHS